MIPEKRNRKVKINKSRLKQIIKEEIQNDTALLKAIDALTKQISNMDVSIDFLSAAIVGGDPAAIGSAQRTKGRGYMPSIVPQTNPISARITEGEYDTASCQELNSKLEQLRLKLDSQEDREKIETQNEIDVIENIIKIKDCGAT